MCPSVRLVSNGMPHQRYEPGDIGSFAGKPGKDLIAGPS